MLSHALFMIRTAVQDRRGVTAAEYAVLAVGIVVAVSTAAGLFADEIKTKFLAIIP